MENYLSWTNTRAMMENANIAVKYGDFTNFYLNELMKHTGPYLFQAFYSSPQVKMKF